VTVTAPPSSAPAVVCSNSATPAAGRPGVVAVTTAGALVKLDPASGAITQTLIPGGVLGDEVAVSPDDSTVYFDAGTGCKTEIGRSAAAASDLNRPWRAARDQRTAASCVRGPAAAQAGLHPEPGQPGG
jgi:hypothetical protein